MSEESCRSSWIVQCFSDVQNVDPWEASGLIFISDINTFGEYSRRWAADYLPLSMAKTPLLSLSTGLEEISFLSLIVAYFAFRWDDLCCCRILGDFKWGPDLHWLIRQDRASRKGLGCVCLSFFICTSLELYAQRTSWVSYQILCIQLFSTSETANNRLEIETCLFPCSCSGIIIPCLRGRL